MHAQIFPRKSKGPAGVWRIHYRGQLGCLPLTRPLLSRPWGEESAADLLAVLVPRGPGGVGTGGPVFVPTRCALQGGREPAREENESRAVGGHQLEGTDEQLEEGSAAREGGGCRWGRLGAGPGPGVPARTLCRLSRKEALSPNTLRNSLFLNSEAAVFLRFSAARRRSSVNTRTSE